MRITRMVLGVTLVLLGGWFAGKALAFCNYTDGCVLGPSGIDSVTVLGLAMTGGVVLAGVGEWRVAQVKRSYQHREAELRCLQDEFIQNVAHELRTPLTLVCGYLDMLADEQLDAETRRRAVAIAVDKFKDLTRQVEAITTLHELKVGRLNQEPVDMDTAVRVAIGMMRQKAARAGVTLHSDSCPELPPVTGDTMRLIETLRQLLDNAIKFSPGGGTVTVRLRSTRNGVRIETIDQGIGIAAEKTKRIFDYFYQIDGSTTRRFGGMGLGLAIVKAVVEAHQGQIWAESNGPGQGSNFILVLPQATQRSELLNGRTSSPAFAYADVAR